MRRRIAESELVAQAIDVDKQKLQRNALHTQTEDSRPGVNATVVFSRWVVAEKIIDDAAERLVDDLAKAREAGK